jgi:hypothetical protein
VCRRGLKAEKVGSEGKAVMWREQNRFVHERRKREKEVKKMVESGRMREGDRCSVQLRHTRQSEYFLFSLSDHTSWRQ